MTREQIENFIVDTLLAPSPVSNKEILVGPGGIRELERLYADSLDYRRALCMTSVGQPYLLGIPVFEDADMPAGAVDLLSRTADGKISRVSMNRDDNNERGNAMARTLVERDRDLLRLLAEKQVELAEGVTHTRILCGILKALDTEGQLPDDPEVRAWYRQHLEHNAQRMKATRDPAQPGPEESLASHLRGTWDIARVDTSLPAECRGRERDEACKALECLWNLGLITGEDLQRMHHKWRWWRPKDGKPWVN